MNEVSVIGATSSLGLNLVSLLALHGYKVFASFRSAGRVPATWWDTDMVVPQRLDLGSNDYLGSLASRPTIWLAHLDQGRFNERETESNVAPFENYLAIAKTKSNGKMIFVSSGGAVYGEPRSLPIAEDHPRSPLSSYGKAKLAMEDRLTEIGRATELKTAIIRPGNIYGFEEPNRECKGIIGAFLNAIRNQSEFTLIHKGLTVRDFIHVSDVSRAILTALSMDRKEIVWNVATGKGTATADVLRMILKQSGFAAPRIKNIENYSSDVAQNVLSVEKIMSESSWRPEIGVEQGIATTLEDWR